MLKNSVLDIWKDGKSVINGWLSIPHSFTAEAMAKMGWDSLTIDIQHGLNDFSTSISMLQAINNNSTVPFVRVPWNEPGIIMKMLDAGACGIIAPMINNKEECEKFVSYCLYPPLGQRSHGPMRAQLIYGSDYQISANSQIVTLAMIETKESVDNLAGETTIICIAHRLSTIQSADRIYHLEAGKIIEEGTFEELIKYKESSFRKIAKLQGII